MSAVMTRFFACALLLAASPSLAQSQSQSQTQPAPATPPGGREASEAAAVDLTELDPEAPVSTLASGGRAVLSRTDAENQRRAAQGRLGLRLGSDMSFRLGERVNPQ